MATFYSSFADETMLAKSLSENPADISGGFFIGISESGECVLKGFGEIETRGAEVIAMKLYLLAERIRAQGRVFATTH